MGYAFAYINFVYGQKKKKSAFHNVLFLYINKEVY